VHGLAFLIGLGVVVPLASAGLEVHVARKRLGWLSATSWGPLGELLGRPPISAPSPASPFVFGSGDTPVRVDAVVDPACPACHNVVDELARLAEYHPTALHVVVHLPTRDARQPADRELRVAITAAGTVEAFQAARDRSSDLLQLAAGGAGAVLAHLGEAGAAGGERLDAARAAQAGADGLADAVERATPTLLVNGRPWGRPAWELDTLLSCYPDRLPWLRPSPGDPPA